MTFEYVRLKRSKFILYMLVTFIISFLLSVLNDRVVQVGFNSNNGILRNYYDGFSQTIPFFLYPLLAYYFAQDFENGVDYFYSNNSMPERKWVFAKAFFMFLILTAATLSIKFYIFLCLRLLLQLFLLASL